MEYRSKSTIVPPIGHTIMLKIMERRRGSFVSTSIWNIVSSEVSTLASPIKSRGPSNPCVQSADGRHIYLSIVDSFPFVVLV